MDARTTVLVADDDPSLRLLLTQIVDAEDDLELIGVASDAHEAVELGAVFQPEVALLDVEMPKGGGVHAARELRRRAPGTRLIALTSHEDRFTINAMLAAGVIGYIAKGARIDEITAAIRRASADESTLSPRVATKVLSDFSAQLQQGQPGSEWRRYWDKEITQLLRKQTRFRLDFQPIIELTTARIAGLEALARFGAGEDGRGPDIWFSEAEAIGLAVELDLFVTRAALDHLDRIPPDTFLSLNTTPKTLLADEFRELLAHLPAGRVAIEITEHVQVDNYAKLYEVRQQLRDRGLQLIVDDAGAGYASLRHILRLEPDIIKLDIGLVRNIHRSRPQRALASAMTTFGKEIGAAVVAEGIEDASELNALRELGVPLGQGYYLARPQPLPG